MNLKNALLGLAFLSLAACHGGRLTAPGGFATLDSDDAYSYRATNAQGVTIGVRTEDNAVKANVDFWAESLDLRLRSSGYAFKSQEVTRTRAGLVGKQIRYEVSRDGGSQSYWLTVFTTDKKVYVVEAAGDKDAFDGASPMVEAAIESLKI